MTSTEIQERVKRLNLSVHSDDRFRCVLWEIALQLAIQNERYALMVERYMEMTAPAVRGKKSEARSQKPEGAQPNK